uniref:ATP-dependent DNA helicase n=1 Tax=Globodera rostochiensis TaxID=31243 RepID=A0A914I8K2_GLORO
MQQNRSCVEDLAEAGASTSEAANTSKKSFDQELAESEQGCVLSTFKKLRLILTNCCLTTLPVLGLTKDPLRDRGHVAAGAIVIVLLLRNVDYYDSGQFGDATCEHCDALLLHAERDAIKKQGRVSPCCSNGECHTEEMAAAYTELQSPPTILTELAGASDLRAREQFLDNTLPLNNTFAFASVHSEKAPEDQIAGRKDTVKYNGQFSFQFSDLVAPQGRRPTFAQVYTLMPEDALRLRSENIADVLALPIRQAIMEKLEQLMRENPYGRTFMTAGAKISEAMERNEGEIPRFQIVLLTDRALNTEAIRSRGECTVIEKTEAPSAQQIAVIWVQEDGLAPGVHGFWVCDKAGKMRLLKSGMPQLDPCCFPLLHPRGTAGWQWFLKKKCKQGRDVRSLTCLDENANDDCYTFGPTTSTHRDTEPPVRNEDFPEIEAAFVEAVPDANEQGQEALDDNHVMPSIDSVVSEEFWQRPTHALGIKKPGPEVNISERQFYRYRLAMREPCRGAFHWLWYARRLAEYFVIALLNRIERNEMEHVKAQQSKKDYRQILARDYVQALEQGLQRQEPNARLGSIFLMPQTFAGSRQYYQQKFVTFSGNPSWPELKEALQGRQQYTHRADIVCRIFMDKATEFIKDLTERNVLGKVAGWCYSVEHQKRGMPHIHILLILDKQGRITSPNVVDDFVSARIPPLPQMDDLTPEANQQRRLWHYVTTMMLHDCNSACTDFDEQGRPQCKKHFPKPYSDHTELSEVRYTNYVRLPADTFDAELRAGAHVENQQLGPGDHEHCGLSYMKKSRGGQAAALLDDSRVIPYNAFLLLKYGCHINIEYVFGQKACKYIFKYLLKGFEKAYVRVLQPRRGERSQPETVCDYDEIAATFKVRYMTSMEAYLRLHSYRIVRLSHQIYPLSLHDELGQMLVIEEGHAEQGRRNLQLHTRLTAFFDLCSNDPDVSELTYDRVPYRYYWNQKHRKWIKRKRPLVEEVAGARMFVRVYTVSPKHCELFAIRALLLHRPGPKSFKDLRTIDGQCYANFTEAAIQLNLLENDIIFAGAMRDACIDNMNLNKLQHFFAMLIAHGRPSDPQKLFNTFLDQMRPHRAGVDPDIPSQSLERRRGEVMRNLEYYLTCMSTSCGEVGLCGLPSDYSFGYQGAILEETRLENDFYGDHAQRLTPQKLVEKHVKKLNVDQRKAFACITEAVNGRGNKRCFFVEGSGGCGKTFLYNTLIRWCLAGKPQINSEPELPRQAPTQLNTGSVLASASTGIAALLLIGGATAHRLFSVPNDVCDDTPPRLAFESAGAKKLRSAELFIIDEISMLSNKVLRYIDRLLRDVCATNKPFGGKPIVLGGDWKQLAPVVEQGTRDDQLQESIKMDKLFKDNFEQLHLSINMRTALDQRALCEWLHIIGNGLHQAGANRQQGRHPLKLHIPSELLVDTLEEIIDFCFPAALFNDPIRHAELIKDSVILSPTNADLQAINEKAMERIAGAPMIYLSIDSPLDGQEELGTFRADFNIEAIHNEMPSGMPPHKLILKTGASVMLIRNLDVSCGLCNGTRMQLRRMTEENLFCKLLTGPREGQEYIIPRVKFEYGQGRHHRGIRFRRIQFPVRPCFAMTAQGQTLQRMGLVLNGKQCFSHGQVYVAMSRVTTMAGIRVFSPHTCVGDTTTINNVIIPELLDQSAALPEDPIAGALNSQDINQS